MSNIVKRGGSLPAVPTETATALQEASTRAMAAFAGATDGGGVLAALEVAEGIADLRALMDAPQIQARVKSLQDTAIGFRTDRGPGAKNRKTGEPLEPYSWPVVRDAVIEAGLRGLQLVGNQFNIISGRFYGTKEGFEYLIRKQPQVSDFRPIVGVPASRPGGVLIECTATWNQSGKPTDYKVTIPVKSDDYSTSDQLIGKATRKLLARCYAIMTGNAVPEGDAADAVPVEATATTASKPVFRAPVETVSIASAVVAPVVEAAPSPARATGGAGGSFTPMPTTQAQVDRHRDMVFDAATPASAPATEAAPTEPTETPQQRLATLVTEAGANFDQFLQFLEHYKYDTKGAASFDELPTAIAARLAKSEKTVPALRAFIQPA